MTRKEELLLKANQICNEPKYDYKSTEDLCYISMEWAGKTMLEKVCEWLEDNIYDYLYINRDFNEADYKHELIEDLKKSMEE